MNILITGGTGTIGRAIVRQIHDNHTGKIIIYSRDESKHASMMEEYPEGGTSGMRYYIGDICDYDRLLYATRTVDLVIHAAAMKHIDKCEYNPLESLRVNVEGTRNVIRACIANNVRDCMYISTDKACNPVSSYGAQKYCGERMMIGANNLTDVTRFNCVRYGNVMGSRGSFLAKWKKLSSEGKSINVTDAEMTRFFWSIEDAAAFVVDHSRNKYDDRGYLYIPKLKANRMIDIALTYSKQISITGLRCAEKIHEELISENESMYSYDCGDHYIIVPPTHPWVSDISVRGVNLPEGFRYTSKID